MNTPREVWVEISDESNIPIGVRLDAPHSILPAFHKHQLVRYIRADVYEAEAEQLVALLREATSWIGDEPLAANGSLHERIRAKLGEE